MKTAALLFVTTACPLLAASLPPPVPSAHLQGVEHLGAWSPLNLTERSGLGDTLYQEPSPAGIRLLLGGQLFLLPCALEGFLEASQA